MENLDLNAMGVVEMSVSDKVIVDGGKGGIWAIVYAIADAVVEYGEGFFDGLTDSLDDDDNNND